MATLGSKQGIPTLAAAQLQCWAKPLSVYTYDIQFKPTSTYGNAGLSKLPLPKVTHECQSTKAAIFNIPQIENFPITGSLKFVTLRASYYISCRRDGI